MKLLLRLEDLSEPLRGGAVAIGNFDGVHRGHARIIERLRVMAAEVGGAAVVFTFEPHPAWILRPEQAPPPLTWIERKAELLAGLGVDAVIAYPTDEALLSLSPDEFFESIVAGRLSAAAMVEGPNFYFGKDREGDVERLRGLCKGRGIRLEVVAPLAAEGGIVSSSRVRRLVREGQVESAAGLLTAPYRIRGMVTHGAGRGRKIGFPTANLSAVDTLLPAHGVYACRAFVAGEPFSAAVNIGPAPTFGEAAIKVEAHLAGYEGVLYGLPLEVEFLRRIRDVRPFASVEELKSQLEKDVEAARQTSRAGLKDA